MEQTRVDWGRTLKIKITVASVRVRVRVSNQLISSSALSMKCVRRLTQEFNEEQSLWVSFHFDCDVAMIVASYSTLCPLPTPSWLPGWLLGRSRIVTVKSGDDRLSSLVTSDIGHLNLSVYKRQINYTSQSLFRKLTSKLSSRKKSPCLPTQNHELISLFFEN